jgi:uncharacterized membrane protein YfcA
MSPGSAAGVVFGSYLVGLVATVELKILLAATLAVSVYKLNWKHAECGP